MQNISKNQTPIPIGVSFFKMPHLFLISKNIHHVSWKTNEKKCCWCFTHGNGLEIRCSQNKYLFISFQACTYFGNVMLFSCVTLHLSIYLIYLLLNFCLIEWQQHLGGLTLFSTPLPLSHKNKTFKYLLLVKWINIFMQLKIIANR